MKKSQQGIALKKRYGQHFIKNPSIISYMLSKVDIDGRSVCEIGAGAGMLTRMILHEDIARLWVFEVDHEWASYLRDTYPDDRLSVFEQNVVQADLSALAPYKPWTLLANLPYNITFPILHTLQEHMYLFAEGIIMVQEEVAQKIVQTGGRGFGFVSLFFQHYFDWKLLRKIPPDVFYPKPRVYSRFLYFKPKMEREAIPYEDRFWQFIKVCFKQPRRTLRNNVQGSPFNLSDVPDALLAKRGQELSKADLLSLWQYIIPHIEVE